MQRKANEEKDMKPSNIYSCNVSILFCTAVAFAQWHQRWWNKMHSNKTRAVRYVDEEQRKVRPVENVIRSNR